MTTSLLPTKLKFIRLGNKAEAYWTRTGNMEPLLTIQACHQNADDTAKENPNQNLVDWEDAYWVIALGSIQDSIESDPSKSKFLRLWFKRAGFTY